VTNQVYSYKQTLHKIVYRPYADIQECIKHSVEHFPGTHQQNTDFVFIIYSDSSTIIFFTTLTPSLKMIVTRYIPLLGLSSDSLFN